MNKEIISRSIVGSLLILFVELSFKYFDPVIFNRFLWITMIYVLTIEWPSFKNIWLTVFFPLLPFMCLIELNRMRYNNILYYIIILCGSHDIGAFFYGRSFGKTKIPLIGVVSPNKTIEGFMAGYLTSFITVSIMFTEERYASMYNVLVCNLISLFGDLFESWLKRRADIKHSGSLLGYHGGVLDRLDGILILGLFQVMFKII